MTLLLLKGDELKTENNCKFNIYTKYWSSNSFTLKHLHF